MAKNTTAFAEFIIEKEADIKTTLLPLIEKNQKQGIKTLVVKKNLEGTKVQVTCIGILVPKDSGEAGSVEFVEVKDGQEFDLKKFKKGTAELSLDLFDN